LRPEDVEEVVVTYTPGGYRMTCLPEVERRAPTSVQHAKFSLFYTVACALARGHVNLDDFSPSALADDMVQRLASRVRVEVDPNLGRVIPPGIVRVRLRDGRELAASLEQHDDVGRLAEPLASGPRPVTHSPSPWRSRQAHLARRQRSCRDW